jgi:hypothetical protein
MAIHAAHIQHGRQSTIPYFYLADLASGHASGLTWINRNRSGEVILPTIGRSVLDHLSLHRYSEPAWPKRIMCWHHLTDHEVLYRALGVQRLLTLNDAIRLLRSEVKRAGSQRAFARKAGVNVSVVSKTLRGIVLPSEKILAALKLRVVYLSR